MKRLTKQQREIRNSALEQQEFLELCRIEQARNEWLGKQIRIIDPLDKKWKRGVVKQVSEDGFVLVHVDTLYGGPPAETGFDVVHFLEMASTFQFSFVGTVATDFSPHYYRVEYIDHIKDRDVVAGIFAGSSQEALEIFGAIKNGREEYYSVKEIVCVCHPE